MKRLDYSRVIAILFDLRTITNDYERLRTITNDHERLRRIEDTQEDNDSNTDKDFLPTFFSLLYLAHRFTFAARHEISLQAVRRSNRKKNLTTR
jgi:hypothetical protein